MHRFLLASVPYFAVFIGMHLYSNAWIALGLYHAGIIFSFFFLKPKNILKKLTAGIDRNICLYGCASAVAIFGTIYFMFPVLNQGDYTLPTWLGHYKLTGLSWLLLIPYFSIVHPVLEEIHWRMNLHSGNHKLSYVDFLFAGYHIFVVFALVHYFWLIPILFLVAIFSYIMRLCALKTKGMATPIMVHACIDFAMILAVHCLLLNN